SPFMLSFGLTALYLGFGGLLIFVLRSLRSSSINWLKKLKVADLAAYVGMYSYSIYLWHGMVSQHIHGFMRLISPAAGETAVFCGYVLTSLAAGIVLSRLVEFPVLHLRDRWFPGVCPNLAVDDRSQSDSELPAQSAVGSNSLA